MSKPDSRLVIYGKLDAATSCVVHESAAAVGLALEEAATPAAVASLIDSRTPTAILVSRDADGAEEVCAAARSRAALAGVPILALASERTEMAFLEAYQRGCDDVVGTEGRGLVRRLHHLLGTPPSPQRGSSAIAVIASADVHWRTVAGRALRHAGVDAVFCGNAIDAIEVARRARFVVTTDDLEPEGAVRAAAQARAAGVTAPWVIVAPSKRIGAACAAAALVPGCAVIDASAPAENAVFIANELAGASRSAHRDARATARLLFATTIAFRVAGRDQDEIGFTYNVSAGGCYVRTLAPLERGDEVWLELFPPRCNHRVRLTGRVAWRRLFGPSDSAIVPPGFGVQITGGLGNDLARYRAGCEALAASMERTANLPLRWGPSWIPRQLEAAIIG